MNIEKIEKKDFMIKIFETNTKIVRKLNFNEKYKIISYVWKRKELPLLFIKNEEINNNQVMGINDRMDKLCQEKTFNGLIWIDKFCIDQNNINEKMFYLRKMSDIYRQAEEMLVLTNVFSFKSIIATNFINILNKALNDFECNNIRNCENFISYEQILVIRKLIQDYNNIFTDSIIEIEKEIWLSRVWTYHERLCAKKITLVAEDNTFLNMDIFVKFYNSNLYKMIKIAHELRQDNTYHKISIFYNFIPNNNKRFVDIWTSLQYKDCLIDHDRIYVLCGLLELNLNRKWYNYNVNIEILFQHVIDKIIVNKNDITILYMAGKQIINNLNKSWLISPNNFSASLDTTLQTLDIKPVLNNEGIFIIKSKIVDEIQIINILSIKNEIYDRKIMRSIVINDVTKKIIEKLLEIDTIDNNLKKYICYSICGSRIMKLIYELHKNEIFNIDICIINLVKHVIEKLHQCNEICLYLYKSREWGVWDQYITILGSIILIYKTIALVQKRHNENIMYFIVGFNEENIKDDEKINILYNNNLGGNNTVITPICTIKDKENEKIQHKIGNLICYKAEGNSLIGDYKEIWLK